MSKYHENTGTPLSNLVCTHEKLHMSRFQPTKKFYRDMGINRIRFSKLLKGEVEMYVKEAFALADFFGVYVEHFRPEKSEPSTVNSQLSTVN